MHATKVAAILAFCAAQGLAAPLNVVDFNRASGIIAVDRIPNLPKRTVVETTSTGDAATDAKVAQELKAADPVLKADMKDLASLAQDEASAVPDLLDALEAAFAPMLQMSKVMQQEVATVQQAEVAGGAGAAGAPATSITTSTNFKRDPLLGLVAPLLASTIGKLISKREELMEVERRKLNGNAVGGVVDGLGNLGASLIGLISKRSEEEMLLEKRRRISGDAIGSAIDGVGNLGASLISLIGKREAELERREPEINNDEFGDLINKGGALLGSIIAMVD
ncbi:hypothetical protein AC578_10658 [Pseudocercospora eumusae]|uniref:Uncharacterized protein n=1 Tax=Pseudocercospora eumusae TaxID=321146 RepID=A0A139HJT2_9PEZI|nr:hypothetical protein AC578_10658 [Pseudocercospora eumusae]